MAMKHLVHTGNFSEFSTISSKGQIVIPKTMRTSLDLNDGDLLAASLIDDMIVLKKVSMRFTDDDKETLKKIDAAWKEIDAGRSGRMTKKEFLKQLQKW